jgi:hypothetical protein
MGFEAKILISSKRRAPYRTMIKGAGSINFDQAMRLSRRLAKSGSIASDWKAVGQEIAVSIDALKKEYVSD